VEEEGTRNYYAGLLLSLARALGDGGVPGFPKVLEQLLIRPESPFTEKNQEQEAPALAEEPKEEVQEESKSGPEAEECAPETSESTVSEEPATVKPPEESVSEHTEEELVSRIVDTVDKIVTLNDQDLNENGLPLEPNEAATTLEEIGFVSSELPGLGIGDYLGERLVKFGRVGPNRLLVALALIERLEVPPKDAANQGNHSSAPHDHDPKDRVLRVLNFWSGHRLLLTTCLVTSKMYQDATYDLSYWAGVGGVELPELLCLEVAFLKRLDWQCSVSVPEYQAMAKRFAIPDTLEPHWD
jgi:hypothetical protein